jgi:hypothetical protein
MREARERHASPRRRASMCTSRHYDAVAGGAVPAPALQAQRNRQQMFRDAPVDRSRQ